MDEYIIITMIKIDMQKRKGNNDKRRISKFIKQKQLELNKCNNEALL